MSTLDTSESLLLPRLQSAPLLEGLTRCNRNPEGTDPSETVSDASGPPDSATAEPFVHATSKHKMYVVDDQCRYWRFWWAEENEGDLKSLREMSAWLTLSGLA